MLEQLQAMDPGVLLDVVRQDQRDPNFILRDWTVRILSDKSGVRPEGLWCFSGHGQSGEEIRPWAVVLKVLQDPGQAVEPRHLWYWKREYLARASGLLAALPVDVTQARSYGVSARAGSAWLWMELVADTTGGSWDLGAYEFAAYQLGRFNGAYMTGGPLPNHPWLAANHIEAWTSFFTRDDVWTNSYVRDSFSAQTRARVTALWQDQARFLALLAQLPQAFSHFDYKRSNLFLRANPAGKREIVAVDWGDCGIGALGGDLTRLVGASTFFRDWDAARVAELDAITMRAYITGLQEMGWHGDPNLVRLAYCAWFALDWGSTAPGAIVKSSADENRAIFQRIFGCKPEEAVSDTVTLCEFALTVLMKHGSCWGVYSQIAPKGDRLMAQAAQLSMPPFQSVELAPVVAQLIDHPDLAGRAARGWRGLATRQQLRL